MADGSAHAGWGFSTGNLPLDRNFKMKLLQKAKLRQKSRPLPSTQSTRSTMPIGKRNLAALAATNNMPKNVKKSESLTTPSTDVSTTELNLQDKRNIASLARDGNLPDARIKKDVDADGSVTSERVSVAAPSKEDDHDTSLDAKVSHPSNTSSQSENVSLHSDVDKRHISSIARANNFPRHSLQEKRYSDSTLDSFRDNDVNKRFYASLLKSNSLPRPVFLAGVPSQDKRYLASLLKAQRFSRLPDGQNQHNSFYSSLAKNTDLGSGVDKRSLKSLLERLRSSGNTLEDEKTNEEQSESLGEDKRHLSSLFQPRNDNFLDTLNEEKRHLASLYTRMQHNDLLDEEKRYLASLFKNTRNQDYLDVFNEEKRHLSSLYKPKRNDISLDMFDEEKRHLGSLYKPRRNDYSINMFEEEKRHLGSLYKPRRNDDSFDEEKRHLASLYKPKRNDDYFDEEKRHVGSLYKPKRNDDFFDNFDEEKRHLASLYKPRRNDDSLETFDEEKRHLASLYKPRRNDDSINEFDEEKRHLGSLYKPRRNDDSVNMFDEEKRHLGSLFKPRRNDDSLATFDEEKRHLGSLYKPRRNDEYFDTIDEEKRHLGSLYKPRRNDDSLDTFDNEKRHFASLLNKKSEDMSSDPSEEPAMEEKTLSALRNEVGKSEVPESQDQRHISSLLKHQYSADPLEEDNIDTRHYAALLKKSSSFLNNSVDDDVGYSINDSDEIHDGSVAGSVGSFDVDKRYFASLLRNRQFGFGPDAKSAEKRYFASLLRNRQSSFGPDAKSAEKRYFASLLKNRQSSFRPYDQSTDKRYFASLLNSRQSSFGRDDQSTDKRHYASLLKSRQSGLEEKRHIGSLMQQKQASFVPNSQSADKRHLGSLLQNTQSSLAPGGRQTNKRHLSSILDDKIINNNAPDHPRRKRYIGALAKSNNMPYPYSRSRQNRRDAPNTPEDNAAYLERLIRLEIQKGLLRKRQRQNLINGNSKIIALLDSIRKSRSPDEDVNETFLQVKRNIQSLARNGHLPIYRAYKRDYGLDDGLDDDDLLQDDQYLTESWDNTNLPQAAVSKRFLSSLARSSWFPRRYRGGYSFDLTKRVTSAALPQVPAGGDVTVVDLDEDEDVDVGMGDSGAFFTYAY